MSTISVNTELITWARERSGLSIEVLSKKFPKLSQWERGELKPTFNQLEELANKTYTPLGYFFLNEPPDEALNIPDYRTLGDKQISRPSPNLLETVQTMQQRQEWMRDFLMDEGENPLQFVGSANIKSDYTAVAKNMRMVLGLSEGWAEEHSNWIDALNELRNRIDNAGILFSRNGVVNNNNYRKLDVNEFRGFVLVDKYAPLIFVNGNDFEGAQLFTIAHELAHIWLGSSALFNLLQMQPYNNETEIFCNKVAAEFLVPEDEFKSAWHEAEHMDNPYKAVAAKFKVSIIVIARRALDLNLISRYVFFDFYRNYLDEMEIFSLQKKGKKQGGNFYNTQNVRLGKKFANAVYVAVKEQRLLYTDAFRLTGLYGNTFDKYFQKIGYNW